MKTKVRLNCYFFSNLIVGLLSLNLMFNNNTKTLVMVNNHNEGKLEAIYVMNKEITSNEEEVVKEETNTNLISVSKKVVASKKVIPYIKPSYNSVTGSNLVNYAKHYIGLPYVHAGNSLETGTDCSGFTRLIYKEFGINLGRTVGSQLYSGSYVSKNDLQPGDLVFYGYSGYASHVTIYIGGGMVIHESTPRDGVKISPIGMMPYITARRLITASVTPKEETKEEVVKENPQEEKDLVLENKDEIKDKVEDSSDSLKENLETNNGLNEVKPNNEETKNEKEEVKNEELKEEKSQEEVTIPSEEEPNLENDILNKEVEVNKNSEDLNSNIEPLDDINNMEDINKVTETSK